MNSLIEEQLKVKNNNDRIPNLTNEDLIELAPPLFISWAPLSPFPKSSTLMKLFPLINFRWFHADHLRAT
jgi:hypothetical protein